MRRVRAIAIAAALTAVAMPARPEPLPSVLEILGQVTNAARPVGNALVIALNLTNFDAVQTYTAIDGSFHLPPLRAGIYRIVAVKYGFAPASATVVPHEESQRVNLRMLTEKQAAGKKTVNQEIWELRGSLPKDILREIDLVMAAAEQPETLAYDMPRFRGEMVSMTGVANARTAATFAQTGVGVHSRLGDGWQIGIRGEIQRIDDPTDSSSFGSAAAEAGVMEMELRSSPTTAYRVATTQSSWVLRDTEAAGSREAAVRSHNFEWEHGDARVNVRYFEHANLFQNLGGSDVIEIAGGTNLVSTPRNDFGVSLRVRQENVRSTSVDTFRTADLAAEGTVELVPSFAVNYGMASRLGIDRTEWAPRTGFAWRLTGNTSLIAALEYKVVDSVPAAMMVPSIAVWSDDYRVLPQYSYSFGIVSLRDENNQLSAIATVSAADAPVRVVFNDGFSQFWDGLYIETGDVRHDIRLAYRRDFGPHFAIDIATTAGSATPRYTGSDQKVYVTGDLQTIFVPTGTTLAISYREIQQPDVEDRLDYHSTRMNVRMAQSLYLPIDVKLLLGVELARVENSPFLLDPMLSDETSRRYVGGLALNF
ncbi:MAG TPA: carboxypeptidase-like regulatory domain-containing protein [Thermoanaerobaculia bacterium]|nr:carboxypeptidase-like regulatory domain-containing protein [Thermoanaerobaculia bacterium]